MNSSYLPASGTSLRVLIVDDETLVSFVIQEQVERLGHKVVGRACDGLQCLELVPQLKPDVVLMDISMPGLDGLETTRRLQAEHPVPVVILTAYDDPDLVTKASDAGAGAYLLKPPSGPEISRTILIAMARFADLCELRRVNAELRKALSEIRVLRGILPICASCKKVRNEDGYWEQVEVYIRDHSEATCSHGLCADCARKYFPELQPKTN